MSTVRGRRVCDTIISGVTFSFGASGGFGMRVVVILLSLMDTCLHRNSDYDSFQNLAPIVEAEPGSRQQCSEFDVRANFWSVWTRTWRFEDWTDLFDFEAVWTGRLTN